MGLFLIPIKDPNKTRGEEQQSQSNKSDRISVILS